MLPYETVDWWPKNMELKYPHHMQEEQLDTVIMAYSKFLSNKTMVMLKMCSLFCKKTLVSQITCTLFCYKNKLFLNIRGSYFQNQNLPA